jgi:hypothetical protein
MLSFIDELSFTVLRTWCLNLSSQIGVRDNSGLKHTIGLPDGRLIRQNLTDTIEFTALPLFGFDEADVAAAFEPGHLYC